MQLHEVLEREFCRVAKDENVTREELLTELCQATGYSARQFYNFRAGKQSIPTTILPYLCRRFASRLLLDALDQQCRPEIEIPDEYDISRLISRIIRNDLAHYEMMLETFESKTLSKADLDFLRASTDRVIQNALQLRGIAEADYERRVQARQAKRSLATV